MEKLNAPTLSAHGLRHYFATQCFEAGVEQKVVQKWMGHSKYSMTIDLYTHVNGNFEKEQATKMAKRGAKKE